MTKKTFAGERPADLPPLDPSDSNDHRNFEAATPNGTPVKRHEAHEKIPPGFVRYRGRGNPFKDGAFVELVIRVRPVGSDAKDASEAVHFMIAGPKRAWREDSDHPRSAFGIRPEEWKVPASEFGSIAATKLLPDPEPEQAPSP